MKHLIFSLAITFTSSIFLFGQTDEKEVKQIMEKYQAALKNNDSAVAESLLADNFYFVSDCGNQNKKQRLESIRSGSVNYEPYTEEDLKIYIAGTMSSIIIKTTITNKIKGCEKYHMPDVAYFTFTKVADHWQIFRECMGRNCTR